MMATPSSIPSSCWSWPKRATARRWGGLLERYRNYVGLLVRLQVGRRLKSKVDVEDLLQEIWLEIHRKIALFRGGSEREFLTWVRRLIGSILANQVRHYLGTKQP